MIAYPLFVKDPYFSIWAPIDKLNESNTIFWTGDAKKTFGILRIEDKSYCFMGDVPNLPKMEQCRVSVSLFRTTYCFSTEEVELEVSFFSPLPMSDLNILSMPVCFVEYEIRPKKPIGNASVSLSLGEDWCYDTISDKEMRGDVFQIDEGEVGYFGLNRQHIMNRCGDRMAAEWGYYYLLAEECFYHTITDFSMIDKNTYAGEKDEDYKFLTARNTYYNLEGSVKGRIIIAFDDVASINYFGHMLQGYYFSRNGTVIDAIQYASKHFEQIEEICDDFEAQVKEDCKDYSEGHEELLNFSYRQTIAAHKLVVDYDGTLLFISKECGSGGCVATADVTYPTMPLLALYNPELLKASMEPIFKVASLPMWDYPFAPHDAGMYPYCCGQYYIVNIRKEDKYYRNVGFRGDWKHDVLPQYYLYPKASVLYDIDKQMPIEECANMLIISAVYLASGGLKEYIQDNVYHLRKWCDYLIEKGLIPQNQLCTDDFMEHIDKNVNLAIKSIVGIRAFADVLDKLSEDSGRYRNVATERANEISELYSGCYMPRGFGDTNDSYSMKYNLLWDKLLGYHLFDEKTLEREVELCMGNLQEYGFPLDSSTSLTKTDWMMWIAALSDERNVAERVVEALRAYIRSDGAKGKAFPDLYDCKTGETRQFLNRTVQGSMFVLILKQKMMNGGKINEKDE